MSLLGRWKKVQQELKQRLDIPRISNVTLSLKSKPYIIGLDISYIKDNKTKAVCTAVLLEYNTCKVIDQETREVQMIYEYQAGFLAFRELDSYIMVYQNLMARNLDKLDQIAFVMLDGNGILHPRGFGLASHFGVITDTVTIGCGKNLHQFDGMDRKKIRVQMDSINANEWALYGTSGQMYGWAVRKGVNPVYISPGHQISLSECSIIIRHIHKFREPEPTRQADRISREYIRNNMN